MKDKLRNLGIVLTLVGALAGAGWAIYMGLNAKGEPEATVDPVACRVFLSATVNQIAIHEGNAVFQQALRGGADQSLAAGAADARYQEVVRLGEQAILDGVFTCEGQIEFSRNHGVRIIIDPVPLETTTTTPVGGGGEPPRNG